MECSYWPLVTFAFLFVLPIQGHEACYEDSWTYHDRTYTCFKLFEIDLTWLEARDVCRQVQLGRSYGFTTRLGKMDDRYTNADVRALLPDSSWLGWIGLYYNTEKGAFRWDGFPDKVPAFEALLWDDEDKPYVSLHKDGWIGQDSDITLQHFVCQHSAKKILSFVCQLELQSHALKITCKSRASPIKAKCRRTHKYKWQSTFPAWRSINNPSHESDTQNTGGDTSFTTTCSTTLTNPSPGNLTVKMQMYPDISGMDLSTNPVAVTNGSITINIVKPEKPIFSLSPNEPLTGPDVFLAQGSDVDLTCSVKTGSPAVYSTTMTCDSPIMTTANHGIEYSQEYRLAIKPVSSDMDGGTCRCYGNHVTGNTHISTLTFRVVTKPTSVVCNCNLSPTSLQVSCQTDKIYPQALCKWSYRQENEQNINPLSATIYTHESDSASDGILYFKSNCSITLTSNNMTFRAGYLTVQVTMNPDQEGIDQDTTPEAFITTQEIIKIEVPNKPQFKMQDKIVQTSSPIHFNENDTIHLSCEVQSGKPTVHSVTMSCEFPFTDSDEYNRHTVPGTTFVMDETASRDMNGKQCTCIGHHLTGHLLSSTLTFNVEYPAEVKSFTVNGKASETEVDLNDTLTLSCMADGNPAPSVTIQKLESSHLDTSTWMDDQSGGDTVEKKLTLTAECVHNGRYRCSVNNQLGAHMAEVDIRVRCPPTYCNGASNDDQQWDVIPGRSQSVSLCVVAYPMPDFRLLKNTEIGWSPLPDFDGQISNVTMFESQQSLTIDFPALGSSHLGQYALSYSTESCSPCPLLYFQLTAPLTPCTEEDIIHRVKVERPATFNLCVMAFPAPTNLTIEIFARDQWEQPEYINSDTSFTRRVDFDTLTNITVTFAKVKVRDLGDYRIFNPEDRSIYLYFTLSVLPDDNGSSSNTGIIVGAVVAVVIVIIVIIGIIVFIRKKRNKDKLFESPYASGAKEIKPYGPEDYTKIDVYNKRIHIHSPGVHDTKKTDGEQNVYDNDGFVFDPRSSVDYDDGKGKADIERPYSNMNVQTNTPDNKTSESTPAQEENDLVYITLDFNVTSDKKTKPQKKPKPTIKPKKVKKEDKKQEEEEEEATEYSAISATATIKIKREKDNEERRSKEVDENKEKDKGEEEIVYENVKVVKDNVP